MSLAIDVNDKNRARYGLIETFTTAEKDTSKTLVPDGDNGVEWVEDSSGSAWANGSPTFSKTGALNLANVLTRKSTTGYLYGTNASLGLVGIKYNITSSSASGAGSLIIEVRYETKDNAVSDHVLGGGTLLKQLTLLTAIGVEATIYRRGDEISFTSVPIVQDRIYYVDVSSVGNYAVTDLEIELIVE